MHQSNEKYYDQNIFIEIILKKFTEKQLQNNPDM